MTVTGPPDDYTDHLKTAAHEALSMTDIVERLRMVAWLPTEPELAIEAADQIERLRAALQEIADKCTGVGVRMARRALEPKT